MLMENLKSGFFFSRTKLTTTQQKSNHSVVLQLVSVVLFVTRYQEEAMFMRQCV